MFNRVSGSGESRRRRKRTLIRSFITNGGYHKPDPNLAFTDSSGHSIKSEIKRIVARRLKECKYLASAQFLSGDDVAQVWTANKTVSRIAKWMGETLNTELNSRATATTFH